MCGITMRQTFLSLLMPLWGPFTCSLKDDVTSSLLFQDSARTRGLIRKEP